MMTVCVLMLYDCIKPGTHWQQSCIQHGRQIGNKVERSTLLPICCRFNKIDRVASVYPA